MSCGWTTIWERRNGKIIRRMIHILVTSVHAKFGASAAKIERSKHPKCEVPDEGDLAHIQGIALMKFIMRIHVFITQLHIINERYNGSNPATLNLLVSLSQLTFSII